jgi:hypothetical protein
MRIPLGKRQFPRNRPVLLVTFQDLDGKASLEEWTSAIQRTEDDFTGKKLH